MGVTDILPACSGVAVWPLGETPLDLLWAEQDLGKKVDGELI